jgi:DNA-binding NarL/FixJ family response regulator
MSVNNIANARVLVVEDHPATRAGLVGHFASQAGFEVCGQTDRWREALRLIHDLAPDLVLLDLQLKDGNGWSLLYETAAVVPRPKILVYSVFDEEVHAARLLRDGAAGYLNKEASLEEVVVAARKVLAGQLVVSANMASELIRQAVGRKAETPEAEAVRETQELSDRELQVFEMISRGMLNKEIAAQLGIGAKTVGSYKARLMGKLGVTNVPDLIRAAREHLSKPSVG